MGKEKLWRSCGGGGGGGVLVGKELWWSCGEGGALEEELW